jgi:hypothetical protein
VTILVAVTPIIYGLILYGAANDPRNFNAYLVNDINESNKDLPRMIDLGTRADDIIALPNYNTIRYLYTLVNTSKNEIDTNKLDNLYYNILNNIKTNSDLKIFKDKKMIFEYLYNDKYGDEIINFRFEYEDYKDLN